MLPASSCIIQVVKDQSYGVIPVRPQDGQNLFLLVQHHAGHWAFPKGHAEDHETDIEAAIRELREETGISRVTLLEDCPLVETYFFKRNGQTVVKTVRYFVGLVRSRSVHIQVAEIRAFRWTNYARACELLTYAESKRLLAEAQQFLAGHHLRV